MVFIGTGFKQITQQFLDKFKTVFKQVIKVCLVFITRLENSR